MTEETKEETQAPAAPPVQKWEYTPLTRAERDLMNAMSLDAYGKANHWKKMLKNGENRPENAVSANGNPMKVSRLHHYTVAEIKTKMETLLRERQEAKAAAEAKQAEKTDAAN